MQAGIYRHYKGHHYQVLGIASDSSIPDRQVVVYIGLELRDAAKGPRLHVRERVDFQSFVSQDGRMVRRFTYVGPEWTGDGAH